VKFKRMTPSKNMRHPRAAASPDCVSTPPDPKAARGCYYLRNAEDLFPGAGFQPGTRTHQVVNRFRAQRHAR
jgi:hypothetical protein